MQRFLLLVTVALCAVALIACGFSDSNSKDKNNPTASTQSVISGSAVKGPLEGAEIQLIYFDDDGTEIEIIADNAPVLTNASGGFEFWVDPDTAATIQAPLILSSTGGTMGGQPAPQLGALILDTTDLQVPNQVITRHMSTASSIAAMMLRYRALESQSAPSTADAQACITKVQETLGVDLEHDPADATQSVAMVNLSVDANLDLHNTPENCTAVEEYIEYLARNLNSSSGELDGEIEDPEYPGEDTAAAFDKIGEGHLATVCPAGPTQFQHLIVMVDKPTILDDGIDTAAIDIRLIHGLGHVENGARIEVAIVSGQGVLSDTTAVTNAGHALITFTSRAPGHVIIQASLSLDNGNTISREIAVEVLDSGENAVPTADAGNDQNVATGSVVALNGSQSSDLNNDPLTYAWTLTSTPAGSAATLSDTTVFNPKFTADVDGEYVAELVVNDGTVDSAPATVTITAATANAAPTADAGQDQNVATETLVTLDGSASQDADGDTITYAWEMISTPDGSSATLASETQVNPTFTADVDGTYVIRLVVNDGTVDSAPSTVTVTAAAANSAPTADAGTDQNVATGSVVNLDGSASLDADGDTITYAWEIDTMPSGSNATLTNETQVDPTFTADIDGTYIIRLVVNDGTVDSTPATVNVIASSGNSAPTADAGTDQNVATGSVVTLDGSASLDADGDIITYAWVLVSTPDGSSAVLANEDQVDPTFTADVDGTYVIRLVVNDDTVDSSPATVNVTASSGNSAPTADAGTDQNVTTGTLVTLDGSDSQDADGDTITYAWVMVSTPDGSIATLANETEVNPTFTADVDGTYAIRLMVNDGTADSTPATVSITASSANSAPTADAGQDQNVTTGTLVTLNGSASQDADGDTITYAWEIFSTPDGSSATLANETEVNPTFTADVDGTYAIRVVVNDGNVDSTPATVTITAATANSAPTANAGQDESTTAGTLVILDGSGSHDADGDTITYAWEFVSKPAGSSATLSNATQVNPRITPDVEGPYVIRLVVNDGTVDSAPATVTITATAAGPDGAQLYADYCARCHGANGAGDPNIRGISADEIVDIMTHKKVTLVDIGGTEGAQAIADFLSQ